MRLLPHRSAELFFQRSQQRRRDFGDAREVVVLLRRRLLRLSICRAGFWRGNRGSSSSGGVGLVSRFGEEESPSDGGVEEGSFVVRREMEGGEEGVEVGG